MSSPWPHGSVSSRGASLRRGRAPECQPRRPHAGTGTSGPPVLGRLISDELVDAHDHPEDGLAKRVQLTGRGLEAYRLLRGAGVERGGGALRLWDPDERERFADLLARFVPQVLGQDGEGAASAQRQASVAPGDRFERRTS